MAALRGAGWQLQLPRPEALQLWVRVRQAAPAALIESHAPRNDPDPPVSCSPNNGLA